MIDAPPYRDGAVLRCVHRSRTGNRPKAVRFSPRGDQLWIANHYDDPAVEVRAVPGWVERGAVSLGEYGAVELELSRDGSRVYASQFETASVFEIDANSHRVLRRIDTGSSASKVLELSADGRRLFVSNWSGHDVSDIDLEIGRVARSMPLGSEPRGLFSTSDGRHLYVAGFGSGDLYRFDLATGRATTLWEGPGSLRHIVGDERRGQLFISDLTMGHVLRVDLRSERACVFAKTNNKPNTIDLSPDGRLLFVSNRGANHPESFLRPGPEWGSVIVFDTEDGSRLDGLVAGNQTTGLSVSPCGSWLAITDFLDNTLSVYSVPDSGTVLAARGGAGESHVAYLPKQRRIGE